MGTNKINDDFFNTFDPLQRSVPQQYTLISLVDAGTQLNVVPRLTNLPDGTLKTVFFKKKYINYLIKNKRLHTLHDAP